VTAKRYQGEGITVTFDPARCLHAAQCVSNLPGVFDTARKPWVSPDAATPERVMEVIRMCPSGALHYEGQPEEPLRPTRIDPKSTGPMFVRGDLHITSDGATIEETRVALCSCGQTANAPFCDGSSACRDWKSAGN
jgi:uncharacterized Fe-S cluster protein YjdI